MEFLIDDYCESVVEVFSESALFRVVHSTDIEREDEFEDCWNQRTESHYTRLTGRASFSATTTIKSITLKIDEKHFVSINVEFAAKELLKKAIEKAAVSHAELNHLADLAA